MAENLRLEVNELMQIAGVIDQGILVSNKDGLIEYANPFACTFFGFQTNELIEKNINLISGNNTIHDHFSSTQQEIREMAGINKFGKEIYYTAKITPSANGSKFVIVISDVTRRIEGRNKLLQKVDTCERLTKSRFIRDGFLSKAIDEIISESAKTLNIERVNAWLIDGNFSLIECIGNFNSKTGFENDKTKLLRKDMPAYFKLLETQEIISTDDTLNDPKTKELVDIYLNKYGITSMMDVPIRIEGEMIGVVCFESTGVPHKWDLTERKFGLFIAQLISLALETNERKIVQTNLEKAYKEKELLLAEIHHRVKNNLAMVSSLLNLQQSKAKDDFHRELFTESKNRVLSIASIHQLLYQNKDFEKVNFANYANEIISVLKESYTHLLQSVKITTQIEPISVHLSQAIPLGLILNEVISNSFKHGFKEGNNNEINVYLRGKNDKFVLEISDNGSGIKNIDEQRTKNTLGLSLIYDLAEQINAKVEYSNKNGSHFIFYLQ
jgi:PAS domain S-box-containing protein